MIDQGSIKGEANTGFEKRGAKGPFECSNCEYFSNGGCNQNIMKRFSKEPRLANGRVKVDGADCCEFIERVGHRKGNRSFGAIG